MFFVRWECVGLCVRCSSSSVHPHQCWTILWRSVYFVSVAHSMRSEALYAIYLPHWTYNENQITVSENSYQIGAEIAFAPNFGEINGVCVCLAFDCLYQMCSSKKLGKLSLRFDIDSNTSLIQYIKFITKKWYWSRKLYVWCDYSIRHKPFPFTFD